MIVTYFESLVVSSLVPLIETTGLGLEVFPTLVLRWERARAATLLAKREQHVSVILPLFHTSVD